ncbi:MAG: IS66 family insertion sequence element accessory protein TnpB [Segetibacter sp.]|nr:IS66 family insertion sequence element accessory protein TnpB [Segetibacter sp.]
MLHLSPAVQYYLYTGTTDMRKGFDSLCGIVSSQMKLDALSGAIFIFINRKRNQVKLLLWEGDGLSLYHKRLEKGTYELPLCNTAGTALGIRQQQLQFILQGVALQKIVYRSRYKKIA